LALVASGALQTDPAATPAAKVKVTAGDSQHDIQDLQSQMLHEEAVKLLRKQPELISRALEILDAWRSSGNTHSRVLWDEWSVILNRRDWRRVLARTRRSKELRQASPLAILLPPEIRERVLEQVEQLKRGITLGQVTPASRPRKSRAKDAP
jgi:hypothetical protein